MRSQLVLSEDLTADTRSMVAHAVQWADSKGLSRVNPVHGKTEYRVPTDWNFSSKDVDRTTTRISGSAELEACPCAEVDRNHIASNLILLLLMFATMAGWQSASGRRKL